MGTRVVVVGAGVIGLATARALARRGAAVVVLDASPDAREASWAAGGILGIGSESAADGPLFRLAHAAMQRWPGVVAELERATQVALAFRTTGTLLVALDEGEVAPLEARGEFHRSAGLDSRMLSGDEARRVERRVGPAVRAALHVPEARLDNRALWRALETACRRELVETRRGTAALGLLRRGERVVGVRTAAGDVEADAVVVAAGVWSSDLTAATGVTLPLVPVKGQMVRVAAPDGFLGRIVKRGPAYLVPQDGHGIVIGTTAEEVGLDRHLDPDVLRRLQATAAGLVPEVEGLPRTEAWAGFRPRLPDLLPAIGPVGGSPGLVLATGHFRNGILLAPMTARVIGQLIAGEPPAQSLEPFRYARLAG